MPYRQAGLTERQAAAHLLSRFTFGAQPGDVDSVVQMGLKNWFISQLDGDFKDDSLLTRIDTSYKDLKLSNSEMLQNFPNRGLIIQMAIKDSVINKDSLGSIDKPRLKAIFQAYLLKKHFKTNQDLFRELQSRKILLAAYSKNQLHEVLTDFWFNHFNCSLNKEDCSRFVPDFERDAIRPNVLGRFQTLLLATAKSPAMLFYLDNFSSSYTDTLHLKRYPSKMNLVSKPGDTSLKKPITITKIPARRFAGLNENYAREVMELHTLGVDGGYTQSDVTQAARILTGWTVYPLSDQGPAAIAKKVLEKMSDQELSQKGFIREGDFLFTPNRHDPGQKVVLGHIFPAGGGYQEGVELLSLLAHHPSTAHFISKKLAIRFVSDNPPPSLIEKMAKTFLNKDGDIREVLITMVSAPEFWSPSALRQKTKSPFEYILSSIRSLNSKVNNPLALVNWSNRMGQQIYYYTAPTGFPDQGAYWINTGALLNRMNFGLALASGRVNGIKTDLLALNHFHEPESNEAALVTYASIMMPERNLDETVKRLSPLLSHPDLPNKIEAAGNGFAANTTKNPMGEIPPSPRSQQQNKDKNNNSLAQVVGIIIGSPEFQRR